MYVHTGETSTAVEASSGYTRVVGIAALKEKYGSKCLQCASRWNSSYQVMFLQTPQYDWVNYLYLTIYVLSFVMVLQ